MEALRQVCYLGYRLLNNACFEEATKIRAIKSTVMEV